MTIPMKTPREKNVMLFLHLHITFFRCVVLMCVYVPSVVFDGTHTHILVNVMLIQLFCFALHIDKGTLTSPECEVTFLDKSITISAVWVLHISCLRLATGNLQ
jgi:hypothetical protein